MGNESRYLGIIEGFYGKEWPWRARDTYPDFMRKAGLNTYVYAPKSDAKLRNGWRESWTDHELLALQRYAGQLSDSGITLGIGLSPVGLVDNVSRRADADQFDNTDLSRLYRKLDQIASISTALLCVLFDDVPAVGTNMAARQVALCHRIREYSEPAQMIVCPSYYSTDPVLEKLFGARPKNYWQELGGGLDTGIDFFWTGEKVCSDVYREENLQFIAGQLGRKPVLWDNYPVNDGAKLSRYLHLQPFRRYSFLADLTAGHLANPMNQPYLSQLPLATLSAAYQLPGSAVNISGSDEGAVWRQFIQRQLGAALSHELLSDVDLFQHRGLDGISEQQKSALIQKYQQYDSEHAGEIVAWLEGQYTFDPACLTG